MCFEECNNARVRLMENKVMKKLLKREGEARFACMKGLRMSWRPVKPSMAWSSLGSLIRPRTFHPPSPKGEEPGHQTAVSRTHPGPKGARRVRGVEAQLGLLRPGQDGFQPSQDREGEKSTKLRLRAPRRGKLLKKRSKNARPSTTTGNIR